MCWKLTFAATLVWKAINGWPAGQMEHKKHIYTIVDGDGSEAKNDWPPFEELDPYAQEAIIELIVSILKNKRNLK